VQSAVAQGFEHLRIHVHADDLQAVRGKGGGGGQADVAQSEDTDFGEVHVISEGKLGFIRQEFIEIKVATTELHKFCPINYSLLFEKCL